MNKKKAKIPVNSRIVEVCDDKKIRQKELIDAGCGSQQTINNVWHSRQKPKIDFVIKLLSIVPNLDANWLLTGKGDMYLKEEETPMITDDPKSEYGFCMDCVTKGAEIKILTKQNVEHEKKNDQLLIEIGRLKNELEHHNE